MTQNSDQRLWDVFADAMVGIVEVDRNGRLVAVNDRLCEMLGCSRAELVGKRVQEITAPEDLPAEEELVRQLLQGSVRRYRLEKRYVRRDGAQVWCEVNSSLLRDSGDTRRIDLVQDISNRKAAEAALRENQERLSLAQLAGRVGVFDWQPDTGRIFWTTELESIFGLPPGEFEGDYESWRKRVHPEDLTRIERSLAEWLASGRNEGAWEYRLIRHGEAEPRWVEARARAFRDARGCAVRVVGTNVDITERRRTRQALQESEARLRLAAQAAGFGTYHYDFTTRRGFWSPEFRELLNLEQDGPYEMNIHHLPVHMHPADRKRMFRILRASIDPAGEGFIKSEHQVICKDGSARWLLVQGRSFFSPEGKPLRATGVIFDITEQKLREETLQLRERELRVAAEERERLLERERQARAEAERANRAKDKFLAIVSHEMRTPISSILGWAQMLASKRADSAHALGIIERNARAQIELIEDLLDVERILSGRLKLNLERIPMRDLLAGAVNAVIPAAGQKRITLESDVGASGELWVEVDAARLRQVLLNLLTNSVKFTPAGGRIRLTVRSAGGSCVVAVADTGEGIDPSFLPHVFDVFQHREFTSASRHHGLGIGLGVAKQIVDLHGGTIAAESDGPGRGAVFTVTLPLAAAGEPAPREGAAGTHGKEFRAGGTS